MFNYHILANKIFHYFSCKAGESVCCGCLLVVQDGVVFFFALGSTGVGLFALIFNFDFGEILINVI